MRALILLALVACETPPSPPPQHPADPNAVMGCRSKKMPLGEVKYTCPTIEVIDTTQVPTSLAEIIGTRADHAQKQRLAYSVLRVDVPGTEQANLIVYTDKHGYAFDLFAIHALDEAHRLFQCHVEWFDDAKLLDTRQSACTRMIGALLDRPAPGGATVTVDCERAMAKLPTLPGRVDPPDGSEELRQEILAFGAHCTNAVAACALAAKSYVEATLCRD